MIFIHKLLRICVIAIFFVVSIARAEVRIVIDDGMDMARPIAILPFKWVGNGSAPDDIANIIAADLRSSGKFNPLPVARMPQLLTNIDDISPNPWLNLSVDTLVLGEIAENGNNFDISYQLVDILSNNIILTGKYNVTSKQLRYASHTISDMVFERLTSVRGAFRTRIAYVVQKNSGSKPYELRVADYDGFNQFVLYSGSQPIMSPAWSADGKHIAFSTFEGRKSHLLLQSLASGKRKIIGSFNGHNGAPSFSPDGTSIVFSASEDDGNLNLYKSDLNGKNVVQLTSNSGNNTEPSWFANNQDILFTSDRAGRPEIYKLNTATRMITKISSGVRSYSAKATADGEKIVMIRADNLVVQDVRTGDIMTLRNTFLDESPSISPNGIMVIYNSTQGLAKVLQLVSIDGRFKARLPGTDGQIKFPAWSPFLTKQ